MCNRSVCPVACTRYLAMVILLTNLTSSLESVNDEVLKTFWKDVPSEQYIEKLNSSNLETFNKNYPKTFIMFYANWCKSSVQAKAEFANAAKEIAYTEGFSDIKFGAFDCNTTLANKRICNKSFGVITYPRFLYFENGQMERMYTVKCPRYSEFFYNWIVFKGNDKYCSGSSSVKSDAASFLTNSVQTLCALTVCSAVLVFNVKFVHLIYK